MYKSHTQLCFVDWWMDWWIDSFIQWLWYPPFPPSFPPLIFMSNPFSIEDTVSYLATLVTNVADRPSDA